MTLDFAGAILTDFLGVNSINRGGCITKDLKSDIELHHKFTANLASCNNRECTYSLTKGAIANYSIRAIRDGCWGSSSNHNITFTAPRLMPATDFTFSFEVLKFVGNNTEQRVEGEFAPVVGIQAIAVLA